MKCSIMHYGLYFNFKISGNYESTPKLNLKSFPGKQNDGDLNTKNGDGKECTGRRFSPDAHCVDELQM